MVNQRSMKEKKVNHLKFVSSDRSSYSDDLLVYIQLGIGVGDVQFS